MRIHITGENDTAKAARTLVRQAGFAVAPDARPAAREDFRVFIDEWTIDPRIHLDSVDGPLETAVLKHVTQLSRLPVVVDRPGGLTRSEREIRICLPADNFEQQHAVELGILRALLEVSGHRPPQPWWKQLLGAAALAVVAANVAFAEPRPGDTVVIRATGADGAQLALAVPANIFPQLQVSGASINLSQIGGTSVSSGLYDSGNTALKVNCVVGCSAAGSFTDNTAFTTGSTSVTNVSGLFNDSATNLTSGNAGAIRATTDRMMFVNIGKLGGTALSGANVVDAGNTAFRVNCVTGCSASAGFTDNSAFTAGTTSETNTGGVFNNDGLAAVTSGNAAAFRITNNRALHVNLRNASGTEIGTASNPVRTDPTGTTTQPVSGTVTTTPPANASTNVAQFGGTNIVTGTGAGGAGIPRVTLSNDSSLAANQSVNLAQVGGTATVTGGVNGTVGTGGTTANGSAVAGNPVQIAGNASGNVTRIISCDKFVAVNINTASTAKPIPLVAGQTTYLCGWHLFSAGTNNVAMVYGTGTNCGTGTLAILGGTTAATGYNFTAQTGIVVQLPMGSPAKETAAANDTCIITSAAVQLSGMISYTQF